MASRPYSGLFRRGDGDDCHAPRRGRHGHRRRRARPDEVKAIGLRYFARYAVVAHANFFIQDVGVPVTLDGQRIEPGDILHGDSNGIVGVPA